MKAISVPIDSSESQRVRSVNSSYIPPHVQVRLINTVCCIVHPKKKKNQQFNNLPVHRIFLFFFPLLSGATGPQGLPGKPGEKGKHGILGPPGLQGLAGSQGRKGNSMQCTTTGNMTAPDINTLLAVKTEKSCEPDFGSVFF